MGHAKTRRRKRIDWGMVILTVAVVFWLLCWVLVFMMQTRF